MNPSRPFILRPVATSLLMVAIMLAGIARLPVPAALGAARSRLSDHPGADLLSRRQPGRDDLVGHRAAGSASSARCRASTRCRSTSSAGASVITLQFSLDLILDVAEQEVQAAINAAGNLLPADLPAPPIYAKVNPADAPILTLGADLEDAAADAGRGPRRHAAGAEDLAASRRRPRQHQRRPAAGGAHPGRYPQARRLRAQYRRPAHHASATPTSTRPRAISTARRAPTRSTPTTSSGRRATIRNLDRRLQERRAGAASATSATVDRRRREQQARAPG